MRQRWPMGFLLVSLCAGPCGVASAQSTSPSDSLEQAPGGQTQPLPWTAGLPVAQVSLEAPAGGLPRENLEPLLRLSQGDAFDPALVRQDIALLVRAGDFASVEVDAEPWFTIDEHGEPVSAVRVVYRVYPPPRIQRINIVGVRTAARRVVLAAHGLGRGEAFFPRRDKIPTEDRVREALVAEGWTSAKVALRMETREDGQLSLEFRVDAGTSRVLDDVVLAPSLQPWHDRVMATLRAAGMKRGQRITKQAEHDARQAIRGLLVRDGYLDPRITLLFSQAPGGAERLSLLGEPGSRTEILATGRGAPPPARVREIVGVQAGLRLSEGTVQDAAEALRSWLQARGWYQARVDARVERNGDDALLILAVDRGARHRLQEITVTGAQALSADTVRAALHQAAPATLGRDVLVDAAIPAAVRTLRELYRGRGYLNVIVNVGEVDIGVPRWRLPLRRVLPLSLPIEIDEGTPTQLASLSIDGASLRAAAQVAAARTEFVGQPYRPGELETLRQDLVNEMRADGYLGADVRLDIQQHAAPQPEGRPAGQIVDAHLVAEPGLQTRLRSVIIRGNSRTRRSVIARELALAVGQPITPQGIEETRRRLYDLDLFQTVSLKLVGEDDGARDLIVVVEERPPMLLELSGGVATDRGVSARGRVALRNLAGRGQRISLLGQTGYAWQGDGWRIDTLTPVWRAAIRYEASNLPARGQSLVAEAVLNETVQEPTFRTSDVGGSLGVRVRLAERSEAYLAYGVHRRTLEDVDPGSLVTGDPWLVVLGLDAVPVTELDLGAAHRLLTGPSLTAVLDRRDDPLDPRQGWRAAGKLDVHDGLLTQQASLRCEGRLDLLAPLGPLILAGSATGGLGIAGGSSNTLPVDERFYLGGSGSLRGFRPSSVGPARRVPRPGVDFPSGIDPLIENTALANAATHWVETGGDAMAAGTLELRVPLATLGLGDFDDTWLVGFSDVGRVAFLGQGIQPTSRVEGRDPAVRVGIGGGLRLATAIGPVSFLIGMNPRPIAQRDEATVLLHFTLGDL